MKSPLWTTIIRTRGKPHPELQEAIESVAGQTYPNASIILSVHSGDAGTLKQIEGFLRKLEIGIPIEIVPGDPSKKRGNPINVGLDNCKGKYVSILDDDDIFYSKMGEKLIPHLQKNKHNMVYGNTMIARRPLDSNAAPSPEKGYGETFNPIRLVAENYIHQSSVIYDFEEFGDIRTSNELDMWEDWYLLLGLLFTNRLRAKYLDEDVSEYRLAGEEDSNTFHKKSTAEIDANYAIIENAFIEKKLTIQYQDVFKVYPHIAITSHPPNKSDIQKLREELKKYEDNKNKRFYGLLKNICNTTGIEI